MRRLLLLTTILSLLLASIVAPYQHVHLRSFGRHAHDTNRAHQDDDLALIHIHFYAFSVPSKNALTSVEDIHGGHISVPLDTFATLPHVAPPALVKPQSQMLLVPPQEAITEIVRVIDPRGHDPPDLDFSSPRAPPA